MAEIDEGKSCDGCYWFRPENRVVKCLNITMVNRGLGWHPEALCRCREYSTEGEIFGKTEKRDTGPAAGVSSDQRPGRSKGAVSKARKPGSRNTKKG